MSQTELEIDYGSILLDSFLNVILPTIDSLTDTFFFIGSMEQLYSNPQENANTVYGSRSEASEYSSVAYYFIRSLF